jgi:DNA-binding beta-propeller fold protein YncE
MKPSFGLRLYVLSGYLMVRWTVAASVVNFETAPVSPVDLSPDGRVLAICNLAAGRLEIFDLTLGMPTRLGNIPVGIDPVSVRFRSSNEAWVVNHISSSISIVDVQRRQIIATLETLPGPADIVFAGSPPRAFITCSRVNVVQVFDPANRAILSSIQIEGERPKALAVAPDGQTVYVAIFESGNASTILAPPIGPLNDPPEDPFSPLEDPAGPYGGTMPPPNSGNAFRPLINPNIPTNYPPPKVSHIVKKNAAGRWMDDNQGDWTEYISGTNSYQSGRIEGWDMPDYDLAVINTATLNVTYVSGLMNLCMAVAVNPVSGRVAVVGTDGLNEIRFEPNLRSTFLRVKLALVNPETSTAIFKDLNLHLNYLSNSLPQPERDKSLGDPRGIVWNSAGTRAYVTGMGSRNLVVLDANGDRVSDVPIELSDGPSGMALDEARERLYVLNRFQATVAVVNTTTHMVMTNIPFFDPTPAAIRVGRKHFYDTRRNSGLGHAACASCHPDGRMDRLAWDLGDPAGGLLTITNIDVLGRPSLRTYHPMKGPMVTQTLQDIIGHEPFHWRGDREGIEDFNQTFVGLLGRDQLLTPTEMAEFKAFLATIAFPPNLARNLDDTLSTNVALGGGYRPFPDEPGLVGDAILGREQFIVNGDVSCLSCHTEQTGLSMNSRDVLGLRGEQHLSLFPTRRSDNLLFKGPQFRNLAERTGLDFRTRSSRAGFGFTHDGRADTLSRFLGSVSFLFSDELAMSAFLLSSSGPDAPVATPSSLTVPPSLDVPTGTGKQLTITNDTITESVQLMIALGDSPSNSLDLIARGTRDGLQRGWYYDGSFLSDRHGEELLTPELLGLASPDHPITFTLVPRGSGIRLGVDSDDDGFFDRTEIELALDPEDASSHGTNHPPQLTVSTNEVIVHSGMTVAFSASATDPDPGQSVRFSLAPSAPAGASIDPVSGYFRWDVPLTSPYQAQRIHVRAVDDQLPALIRSKTVVVEVIPLRMRPLEFDGFYVVLRWDAVPGLAYRLETSRNLNLPWVWELGPPVIADSRAGYVARERELPSALGSYFRVKAEP